MLELDLNSIGNKSQWKNAGIALPSFDIGAVRRRTAENPEWLHFGAGNIFRAFIADLQQRLLNEGKASSGIIAAETFDPEIIEKMYDPFDNLSLLVVMKPDGSHDKTVVAGVCESLIGDPSRERDWNRLREIFTKESLRIVSFTITEKGYGLTDLSGKILDSVKKDMNEGPASPSHVMSKIAALAYWRFRNGSFPLAFVSMDNCSHNGDKLRDAVMTISRAWMENGFVGEDFISYLLNPEKISFPWSMIDKITPRPSDTVKEALEKTGFSDTEIVCTEKKTYIAPFVNAEGPQYLVIEDSFPNGRPALESAGVFFTDRNTVEKVERMKVCTCLNPLHTALAVFGCLLGYTHIAAEMKSPVLRKLAEKIGYDEGLPVVSDPGIISPADFIKEVIEQRLPNPYIPDTPQRIACDTSQKVGIRFGETIKAYMETDGMNPSSLKFIPLVIAGWCRYLLAVDDNGNPMALSPDPMLKELSSLLAHVRFGDPSSAGDSLRELLSNLSLFGVDLYSAGIGERAEQYFREMISGPGAVARTLVNELA
jgi:fructuronate reductase